LARDAINSARNAISEAKAQGFNVEEAENLLSQAEQAYDSGDYEQAIQLAEQAEALALEIIVEASLARDAINSARNAISEAKAQGFNVEEAENLLSQAEQAYDSGDYEKARQLAEEAESIALDVDRDGVPNDRDFAPTINNYYIYAAIAISVIAVCLAYGIRVKRGK